MLAKKVWHLIIFY